MSEIPAIVLPHGGYRNLIVYRKSEVIYQGTVAFCRRFLPKHKEEIVKEAMDVEKGAVIELDAEDPKLTTPNTRKGLFYQLREGETLGEMKNGDSTVGDGQPWTPEIKVKGGNSAFYSIGVGKGE